MMQPPAQPGSDNDRVIECGIYNLRDYGGYATCRGRLARGLLFRSAQHFGATPGDLTTIGGLGLASIIDLRNAAERRAAPSPRPTDFDAVHIHVDDADATRAPHLAAAQQASSVAMARETMITIYREMAFRPYLIQAFRLYLHALARGDGPSLVHCAAGKDRTGFAVALTHLLAGVHPDDVMDDYLMTGRIGNLDERVAQMGNRVRKLYGSQSPDAAVRVILGVEPAFLEAGLTAVSDAYGSIEAYAESCLCFSAKDVERLQAAVH